MSGAYLRVGLSPQSVQLIQSHIKRGAEFRAELKQILRMSLVEMESHLMADKLRGGSIHEKRGGNAPLASRSGALLQSITHRIDKPLSGFLGVRKGPATPYASVQLGDKKFTMTPNEPNKYLWIPIADNLTPKGVARMSPREARGQVNAKGKKLLHIFKSKAGNMVATLAKAAKVPGVRRKGDKLMFVLKKSVEVQGTNAMAEAAQDKAPNMLERIEAALKRYLD